MMGNRMFQLLYLTDIFLFVLSVPYKYILVQQEKTWSDARTYCQANYIDLAIADVSDDMVKLQNEAQKQQFTSYGWIGLYNDVNSWRWSLGNQSFGGLTDWCGPEPTYKVEGCVALNHGCWFDMHCSSSLPFVCFDASNTGSSRYIFISTALTFPDAQSYCRQHYTDLASATTTEENTIVKQTAMTNAWFGLSRDIWMWSDRNTFSTFSWLRGSPWGVQSNENCGTFINGLVDAAQCSNTMPFFCLRDFTKKKIIKIKIRSNQDLNDSAMMAAILQKIKQKLQENGISINGKIKWREQPDGRVFQKIKVYKAQETCDF
ncbi:hypothetical protein Q7C36_001807 [Tachysurus vachellii]|uniref:C-type lectin domain-containing protein n=1 Tax=Tachysurus vachellii TaxID=175792 RepID=A0AA88NTI5_TACVA|nr:hypothetical protein Q7C36_001807 [Tachysurus vachellii]